MSAAVAVAEIAGAKQSGPVAGDFRPPRPRAQGQHRGLGAQAQDHIRGLGQIVKRGQIHDVVVLDVTALVTNDEEQLGLAQVVNQCARKHQGGILAGRRKVWAPSEANSGET